jgi:hypothetical protein
VRTTWQPRFVRTPLFERRCGAGAHVRSVGWVVVEASAMWRGCASGPTRSALGGECNIPPA